MQRRILANVGNLSDCMADSVIISEPSLLLLQGSMRQIPDPKTLANIWEHEPQTICVFTQSQCQNDKRNRWFLKCPSECLFDFSSSKADAIRRASRCGSVC